MNKKLILVIGTAIVLACSSLPSPATTPTPTTIVPSPTVFVTETALQPEQPQEVTTGSFTIVRLHPQDGDLQTMLSQEAQKSIALGQMPVVEFDATWCGPCIAITEGLEAKNELMLDAYAGTYIIRLDVDEWGWSESNLHNFEFDGIPVYFKLDAQGQPTGETIDGDAWGENIPENIAPPMDEFFHGN